MHFLPDDIIPNKTMKIVEKFISIVVLLSYVVFPLDTEKIKKNIKHGIWWIKKFKYKKWCYKTIHFPVWNQKAYLIETSKIKIFYSINN